MFTITYIIEIPGGVSALDGFNATKKAYLDSILAGDIQAGIVSISVANETSERRVIDCVWPSEEITVERAATGGADLQQYHADLLAEIQRLGGTLQRTTSTI